MKSWMQSFRWPGTAGRRARVSAPQRAGATAREGRRAWWSAPQKAWGHCTQEGRRAWVGRRPQKAGATHPEGRRAWVSAPHRKRGGATAREGRRAWGGRRPHVAREPGSSQRGLRDKGGPGAPLPLIWIISENWICLKSLPHPAQNSHRTASKVGARIPN